MGATRDDFVKYPRTPHLFGSRGTADDRHWGRRESEAFIRDPSLIIEEKLDGTNVGIHFTKVKQSEHWQQQALTPNLLADGADLWA